MNFATSILYEICSSSMLCFACLLTNVENVLDFQIAQIKPEKEKVDSHCPNMGQTIVNS